MNHKRWISYYIVLLCLGAGLLIAGAAEWVDNFWSGFGGGLMGVAVVRLILMYRYSRNEEYRKAVEISNKDERNKFLATQARNWTMYFTVLILSALCFAFQVAGQTLLSECCGFIVCGMMVIYWIAYLILRRKY